MKKKNPVLQKKFDEGFEKGVMAGREQAISFFIDRFKELNDVPGIGEKTLIKIQEQLGEKYFM